MKEKVSRADCFHRVSLCFSFAPMRLRSLTVWCRFDTASSPMKLKSIFSCENRWRIVMSLCMRGNCFFSHKTEMYLFVKTEIENCHFMMYVWKLFLLPWNWELVEIYFNCDWELSLYGASLHVFLPLWDLDLWAHHCMCDNSFYPCEI